MQVDEDRNESVFDRHKKWTTSVLWKSPLSSRPRGRVSIKFDWQQYLPPASTTEPTHLLWVSSVRNDHNINTSTRLLNKSTPASWTKPTGVWMVTFPCLHFQHSRQMCSGPLLRWDHVTLLCFSCLHPQSEKISQGALTSGTASVPWGLFSNWARPLPLEPSTLKMH